MDFQDVARLTIPEGEVRTIKNNLGEQLWGRVNYSTKYVGNTTQQTYTGKNLINLPNYNQTENGIKWSVSNTNHAVGNGTTSSNAGSYLCYNQNVNFDITGNFTFSISKAITAPIYLRFYNNSNTNLGQLTISTGNTFITGTIPAGATKYRILLAPAANTQYNIDIYVQLETGTTPTDIEPFVGGTPSPNPSYPQTVNVVTGVQTVSISDGTLSEDFIVDLGNTELCKVGTYQDYVYKSGDDWYVHKEIGKVTYNGSETWYLFGNSSGFFIGKSDALAPTTATDQGTMAVCSNYYSPCVFNDIYNSLTDYGVSLYGATAQKNRICIRNKDIASVGDFQTWLSSNNTTVYYALASATDSQITDSTLIDQLNAIHEWLTRYGYDATVSGNIPLIVDKTNL